VRLHLGLSPGIALQLTAPRAAQASGVCWLRTISRRNGHNTGRRFFKDPPAVVDDCILYLLPYGVDAGAVVQPQDISDCGEHHAPSWAAIDPLDAC
jgi:hypothetical protein